jgi:hypothetical protein
MQKHDLKMIPQSRFYILITWAQLPLASKFGYYSENLSLVFLKDTVHFDPCYFLNIFLYNFL